MIELVVFDMAGTTVDEGDVVYKTVRAAINAGGYSFTQAQVQAVGDSEIDIVEGHNAECGMTFGVTTGAQTQAQLSLANPTAIIHQLNELLAFVDIRDLA